MQDIAEAGALGSWKQSFKDEFHARVIEMQGLWVIKAQRANAPIIKFRNCSNGEVSGLDDMF